MAFPDPHQTNDFPGDPLSHYTPHQHHIQNAWVPPAPANPQPDGHRENVPQPLWGVAGPGIVQDPHLAAYQGVMDHHPQPLNPGFAQGIPAQAQLNAPVNPERNPFGYVPQHNAQGPIPTIFPDPFVHRVPTPNQGGAENLRRLASRYVHHPDAQVGMVSMETGAAGRLRVVIILEMEAVFL